MDGPYLTAKLGASLVSLCARATCVQCGESFERTGSARICSDACRVQRSRRRDRVRRPRKTERKIKGGFCRRCLWCMEVFEVRITDIDSGRSTGWFCSRECAFSDMRLHGNAATSTSRTAWSKYANRFARGIEGAHCRICARLTSSPLTLAHPGCCRDRWIRVAHCATPIQCKRCRVEFCRLPGTWSRHCSDGCNEADRQESRRANRRRHGSKSHKHRARKHGVIYEPFNPLEVLARDRWRCQLCGIKTPQTKRGTIDDDAPELDHIVPLSKGGGHTRANTQCLCRRCNGKKSNTARGQLGLTF
jgi:hypothetical protein